MNKKILILLTGILVLSVSFSCNKVLDVDSSRLAKEEAQWKKLEDARSSLMGMYGLLRAALAEENGHWMWGELRKGDFTATSRADLKAIIAGELNVSYPSIQTLSNWRRFYTVINSASVFIERAEEIMEKDPRYTELNYKVDVAQARVIRAFAYFYMVRIWGDVPLITSANDGAFVQKERTDQATVMAFAESEILKTVNVLPFVYGELKDEILPGLYYGGDRAKWSGVLFNRISAYAILAHIAAWQEHYFDCAVYTDYVMNNYKKSYIDYTTLTDLTSNFFSNPNFLSRHIVASQFVLGEYTGTGHIEELALAAPVTGVSKAIPDIYVTKDSILTIFPDTETDMRFGFDVFNGLPRVAFFTNYYGETPVFSKIKCLVGGATTRLPLFNSAIVFTRIEEMALLRAEALATLGQKDEATDWLNRVRGSRGLAPIASSGDLISAIFAERRRELMGEGWRWYDIVRYNKLKKNATFLQLIKNGGAYWPVAGDVMQTNSKISQYPYWAK